MCMFQNLPCAYYACSCVYGSPCVIVCGQCKCMCTANLVIYIYVVTGPGVHLCAAAPEIPAAET